MGKFGLLLSEVQRKKRWQNTPTGPYVFDNKTGQAQAVAGGQY